MDRILLTTDPIGRIERAIRECGYILEKRDSEFVSHWTHPTKPMHVLRIDPNLEHVSFKEEV
jgi:hypothetical protein